MPEYFVSLPHGFEEAVLYAHPGYWDGHRANDGDAERVPYEPPTGHDAKHVVRKLHEYHQKNKSNLPMQSFGIDQEFDTNSHAVDTIVALDTEVLYPEPGLEIADEFFADVRPPERTVLHYGSENLGKHYHLPGFWYFHWVSIGLVRPVVRNERRVVGIHLGSETSPPGYMLSTEGCYYHPAEFVVGAVRHTNIRPRLGHGIESISRINRVDIMALGKTQTKRSWREVFGMRLRTNES